MKSLRQKKKFERLVVLHRPDCSALEISNVGTLEDSGSLQLTQDDAIKYATQARPIYEALRRVVGQIAGLLILAQLTRTHEVLDLPELVACEDRCKEASERIKALSGSAGKAGGHFGMLEASHRLCRSILDTFPQWRTSPDPDVEFSLMEERLRAAYQYLTAGSWEKGGLSMVDFRNACCSCELGSSKI